MTSKTAFKTINEFLFKEGKTFVVPNYQRGYKWAVKYKDDQSAVEILLDNLIKANKNQQYFLQGVTVCEEGKDIILIDGQQRTTTLYLLLWYLDKERIRKLDLNYSIREESQGFIREIKEKDYFQASAEEGADCQDVYYFKKAIQQIRASIESNIKSFKKDEFIDFLLEKVTILYIVIDKEKAVKTFTMMNGSKATMLQEELIKADMLRLISRPETQKRDVSTSVDDNLNELREIISEDWETNALRSRYAREWDKWLYWWNRNDVKEYFGVSNPMGLLIQYYFKKRSEENQKNDLFNFDNFHSLLQNKDKEGDKDKKPTKLCFKGIRDLQKSFEDVFNNPILFNCLGLALIGTSAEDKYNVICYFFDQKNEVLSTHRNEIEKIWSNLYNYSKWKLIGVNHNLIISSTENAKKNMDEQFQKVFDALSDDFVYGNSPETAYRQLLRLNLEQDNKLFRKFNFFVVNEKSLEHIYPKSKVFHKDEKGNYLNGNNERITESLIKDQSYLDRDLFEGKGSEHCIGNLALLYKNENSKFGPKSFSDKKALYFNIEEKFESRNLLHTISVFACKDWHFKEIIDNKKSILEKIKNDYNLTNIGGKNEI